MKKRVVQQASQSKPAPSVSVRRVLFLESIQLRTGNYMHNPKNIIR
jgi:hypothetical protein